MTEYKYTTCVNSDKPNPFFYEGQAKTLIISSTDHMLSIEGISTKHIRIMIHVTNKMQQIPGRCGQNFYLIEKLSWAFFSRSLFPITGL